MTVGEALAHSYMTEYYLPEDEPVTNHPFNLDEPIEHTLAQWKGRKMYKQRTFIIKFLDDRVVENNNLIIKSELFKSLFSNFKCLKV